MGKSTTITHFLKIKNLNDSEANEKAPTFIFFEKYIVMY